jgi:hypothetical protein
MKAPIAQAGEDAACPPGCAFVIIWGLEIVSASKKTSAPGGVAAPKIMPRDFL